MLTQLLINYAKKTPFFHLEGYMNRYWVLNPHGFLSRFFTVRVHEILRSDNDRHLHDHPWDYITVILKGGYYEVTHHSSWDKAFAIACNTSHVHKCTYTGEWKAYVWYGPGSILRRKASHAHRLIIPYGATATTLFIMGNKKNEWGFLTENGKIDWKHYV